MTRERALKVLEMFLDKQCSIKRTLNHMDTTDVEIWDAVYTATKALSAEPCEDAISRQAAQDYIAEYLSQYLYDDVRAAVEVIDEYIGELPPVTPKQKTGHWKDRYHDMFKYYCSKCETGSDLRTSYCPNCGAKMSDIPTGSNCTACILDGTDACSRGAGRAVDGRVCEDFVGESEDTE